MGSWDPGEQNKHVIKVTNAILFCNITLLVKYIKRLLMTKNNTVPTGTDVKGLTKVLKIVL